MSLTTERPMEPREVLRTQLVRMSGEFKMALPNHITPDKFQRTVMTAAQQNPELIMADRRSFLMAATKCATDGLLPDGREAAFVIFNTKVKVKKRRADGGEYDAEEWVPFVQYMPMRAGVQKRAYNTGRVSSLQGHIVYENDHFVWHQGTEEKLEHKPLFPGERGRPIGAYAVAHLKGDDRPLFRVMDVTRIEKARAVSKSKNGPAWRDWWDEMAIKTVLRNLAKDLPAGAEIEDIARRDDEVPSMEETTETIDAVLTDDQRALPAPSRLDAIEGLAGGHGDAPPDPMKDALDLAGEPATEADKKGRK